jgi:hypothetical protein
MERAIRVLALLLVFLPTVAAADQYGYVDLVRKLTDLEGLAVLPAPGEECRQWSSYDRASRYDEDTGKYVDWGANGDGNGFIRVEGESQVFAEMEGPGCIWRIWSALAEAGHVRIYLDGAPEPAVDLPFIGYFDRKNAPFTYPSLVHNASGGQNCYVPIPYRKSCKVVADGGWGQYYHIVYTTYPKGTIIPTFTRHLTGEETAALAAADEFLSRNLGTDPAGPRSGEAVVAKTLVVPAGGSGSAADLKGERAITAIRVKLDREKVGDATKRLREVILRIRWDGETTPSVWVPLGDFFGTAPGIREHRSLPCGMSEDSECYSFWYMPFAKSAAVDLVNEGKEAFPLEISITHAPLSRPIDQLGRLHVKWHRDAFLPTEPEREVDWPLLKTEGRGRYCGIMLHVWNPQGGWWGEGDEKFFVDGEKFPSTYGTGSEDYFGYAWCCPALFQNAYHNQTISEGNAGNVSVNRWHITDNIPFQRSFEGMIEKYGPKDTPTKYAATAFWYLAPGQTDPYVAAVPVEDRTAYYRMRPILRVPGAIEAEKAEVLEVTGGEAVTQQMYEWGDLWSGEEQIWWAWPKPGDKLVLAILIESPGEYHVKAQLTKAGDYAIVQPYMDGRKLGEPIDLYNPNVVPTGTISLGTMELSAGRHRFTLEIVGANPASAAHVVGIDFIILERVQ